MDKRCHDCGVQPGELHLPGCDVEACPYCGLQMISCLCDASEAGVPDDDRMPYTGEWPGEAECREFGWYAKENPNGGGWVSCSSDDPEAQPDLNRLFTEAVWDRTQKRWVRS